MDEYVWNNIPEYQEKKPMTDLDCLRQLNINGCLAMKGPFFITQTELEYIRQHTSTVASFKYTIENTYWHLPNSEISQPLMSGYYHSHWFFDMKDNLVAVIHTEEANEAK